MAHFLFIDSNECGLDGIRMAKDLGHEVTFVGSSVSHMYRDTPENAELFARVDHIFATEFTTRAEAIIELLRDHVARLPVDAGIAPFEGALEAASRVFDAFGIPFSSPSAIETARNKNRARAALQKAGLANAAYRLVHTVEDALRAADEIGYPVILKPVSGMDSTRVGRVDMPEELRRVAQGILGSGAALPQAFRQAEEQFSRGILVEQRLIGKMVSVEIGLRGDETHVFMCSGRQNTEIDECLPMGVFMPSDLSDEDRRACEVYAERVCRVLGLTFGIYHIELMVTETGPVLVEANARLMGGIMPRIYRVATGGAAIEHYMLQLHLNEPLDLPLPTPCCTALVRRFIAAEGGTIPATLDTARVSRFAACADEFVNYKLVSGTPLNRLDLIGRAIVTGRDFESAAAKGDGMIEELESIIRVRLVRTQADTRPFETA